MRRALHWLACHSVLVVLLLFALVAGIFRGALFGLSDPVSSQTSPPSQAGTTDSPAEPPTGMAILTASTTVAEDAASPRQSPETVVSPEPAGSPTIPEIPPQADTLAAVQPAQPTEPPGMEAETGLNSRPASQVPVMEQVPVMDEDLKTDLLHQARKAYWNDHLNKAKSLYLAYIDLDPENPDGYGELGNLLGTAGELDAAEKMYARAAQLLTEQDRLDEAEQLIQVLESINVLQQAKK